MSPNIIERLRGDVFRDPWKVSEYRSLARSTAMHLGRDSLVLDAGCGDGLFSISLAECVAPGIVVGMDITPQESWHAENPKVRFLAGDANHPPLRPQSVSCVVAKDLLHHVEDPVTVTRALAAMTSKRIVLVEANAENPIMSFYARENGDRHFTPEELSGMLDQAIPGLRWSRDDAVAYPFYLPPVRGTAALWVWPVTGIMLAAFKGARSSWAAGRLRRYLSQRDWPPPFVIFRADLISGNDT